MIIFISLKSVVHSGPGDVDTLLARRVVEKDHHQDNGNFERVLDALNSFLTVQSVCLCIQRFQRRMFETTYIYLWSA